MEMYKNTVYLLYQIPNIFQVFRNCTLEMQCPLSGWTIRQCSQSLGSLLIVLSAQMQPGNAMTIRAKSMSLPNRDNIYQGTARWLICLERRKLQKPVREVQDATHLLPFLGSNLVGSWKREGTETSSLVMASVSEVVAVRAPLKGIK
jgi:hypothetical protein